MTVTAPEAAPASEPESELRRRRHRTQLLTVGLVAVVLVVWAAGVVWSAALARDELRSAESDLRRARDGALELELEGARDSLAEASRRIDRAVDALDAPHVVVASYVPWLGRDLRVARAVARGSQEVVEAGMAVTRTLDAVGGLDGLLPRDGAIPTDPLISLAPVARDASDAIAAARGMVADAPEPAIFAEVAEGRSRFLETLSPLGDDLDVLAQLAEALPALLGAQRPATYFLAAANPAESRGVQGYLGAFALATFDRGELSITPFRSVSDLPSAPDGDVPGAPEVYETRYRQFGGAGLWKNLNISPDFPTVATAVEQLWQSTQNTRLDGVILVDPFAFATLIRLSGPIQVDDGRELGASQVVRYTVNQAYEQFDDDRERKGTLGQVAAIALSRFLDGVRPAGLRRSVSLLAETVADRHLLIHSTDPGVQAVLERLGLDGSLPTGGELLAVVTNSATNAKVDYYLERDLDYRARIQPDGTVHADLEVTFRNDAPADGAPKHVLGPNVDGLTAGDNRFLLSTFCTAWCSFEPDARGEPPFSFGDEAGRPVADELVEVPRGTSLTRRYRWVNARGVDVERDGLVLRIHHRDQVTIRPTRVTVEVSHPGDWQLVDVPDGATRIGDRTLAWTDDEPGDDRWEIVYRRVDE